MKVVIAEVEPWELGGLIRCILNEKHAILNHVLTEEDIARNKDVELLSVFIHTNLNKEMLEKMPKLKYIITRSTGFDHIDIKECKKRRIKVANVPAYGTETVAEHTFALMLALSRKLPEAVERTRLNLWNIEGLKGFDLAGKTLGIIGFGKIGQNVAEKAKAFRMNIIVSTLDKDSKLAKKMGIRYVELKELLNKSDIISLHAPLTEKTRHMINRKNIKEIKPGAFLINTARGELIETRAIIEALDKKILSGAALDVLEGEGVIIEEHELLQRNKINRLKMEQLLENHLLMHQRNVIITPHIAFYTKEALERILNTTCDNIKSCLKGKPINVVN